MPIVCKTPMAQINAQLERYQEGALENAVYLLHMIGEAAVKRARELTVVEGSFHDITGNLRSSIGYTILVDGKERETSDFAVISGSKGRGTQGADAGQAVLNKLKSKYGKGVVLIVCAGMKYAAYVENVHGKRVLVDAKLKAEQLADKLFRKRK